MNFFRNQLKFILGQYSKFAIKKHQIELIVITGWYGTEIAREMLYTLLSEHFIVRRNTKQIWWDFSIPLAILGYADKKRNLPSWILLLIKAGLYLIFGKKNPHILILSADCTLDSTARYWSSFIQPEYLLVLNYQKKARIVEELIQETIANKGQIVFDPEKIPAALNKQLNKTKKLTFSQNNSATINIKPNGNFIKINYLHHVISLPRHHFSAVSLETIGGTFAVSVLKGLDLYEIGFNSLKFALPDIIITKIKNNLAYN